MYVRCTYGRIYPKYILATLIIKKTIMIRDMKIVANRKMTTSNLVQMERKGDGE